ncbi:hypothetical protein ACJJIL_09905 [Microbulbifer sp. EKSA005]|uniref:hypothetical protein n=1 Tax=Microbulbifer sp. EKSA005 TaxID=3243364 RepID=UPI0040420C1E
MCGPGSVSNKNTNESSRPNKVSEKPVPANLRNLGNNTSKTKSTLYRSEKVVKTLKEHHGSLVRQLRPVDTNGSFWAERGRVNSKRLAEILPLLPGRGIDLRDYTISSIANDGKINSQEVRANTPRRTKLSKLRNRVLKCFTVFKPDTVKNAAKTGQNMMRASKVSGSKNEVEGKVEDQIDTTLNEKVVPSGFDSATTSVGVVEYLAGIGSCIKLLMNNASEKERKSKSVLVLDRSVKRANALLNRKLELLKELDAYEQVPQQYQLIKKQLHGLDEKIKDISLRIISLKNSIDNSDVELGGSTEETIARVKIFRYCCSIIGAALSVAAKLTPEGSAVMVAASAFGVSGGAQTLAGVLDAISLKSAFKSSMRSERLNSSLTSKIRNLNNGLKEERQAISVKKKALEAAVKRLSKDDSSTEKAIYQLLSGRIVTESSSQVIDNLLSDPDFDTVKNLFNDLMCFFTAMGRKQEQIELLQAILRKQPGFTSNLLKPYSKVMTTAGYMSGAVAGSASLAMVLGAGGAVGVVAVASPVGLVFAATGAAAALGITGLNSSIQFVDNRRVSAVINNFVGKGRKIKQKLKARVPEKSQTQNFVRGSQSTSNSGEVSRSSKGEVLENAAEEVVADKEARLIQSDYGLAHQDLFSSITESNMLPKVISASPRGVLDRVFDQLCLEFSDILDDDKYLPDIGIPNNRLAAIRINNPIKQHEDYEEIWQKSLTVKLLKEVLSPIMKNDTFEQAIEGVLEAARVCQVDVAKGILAKLINVK